ncbi:MAG TPA: 1,4-dihydroxy-6-naphthoate synthase [Bacteroidales bacterium]|nr:1,4-dihydroxy-6-naphthoate synthase [Bacteroidales bacterium]HOL98612.1 1,4-dihydroxy-6-naphthoate synthase [Bacteroidales bacterium]HOM36996.1 1,4-dihydroxy-6-naphthoate synthase [Bacteroidales bacterium]HPD24118.1 1,4-dihydroxy-6-naphthoate synthase [Bacteroidales bacterium]HRS99308.1 1,4-dihydroxy-6-naphthoate synthase [Bacteroidales bacterium]
MKIKIAFSSCPNDTFIFDFIVNKTKDFEVEYHIADIDVLNKSVENEEFDLIKISFNRFFEVIDKYQLLDSGSAMGDNCGPLLVSRRKIYPDEIIHCKIAIPGYNTTANLLLKIFFPDAFYKKVYLFSDIEQAVLEDECDVGLIIHESRFTYHQKGLRKIADLGQMWKTKFNCPIPLGGIAVKRSLDENLKTKLKLLMKNSVVAALENPQQTYNFVKSNAYELDEDVIYSHIKLYVNDFTVEMGEKGRKSIITLYKEFCKLNNLEPKLEGKMFL